MTDARTLSDLDLLVEAELTAIDLFGGDTYKHEHRDLAARLRAELTTASASRRWHVG